METQFAACTTEELVNSGDVLALFFTKVSQLLKASSSPNSYHLCRCLVLLQRLEQHPVHCLQSLLRATSCRLPSRQSEVSMADWGQRLSLSICAVKQEIARLGIIPFPAFFAKSTRYDTPGPALLLHFIFSTVFIIATPLSNANGYLVFSTVFYYDRTLVASKCPVISPGEAHLNMPQSFLE